MHFTEIPVFYRPEVADAVGGVGYFDGQIDAFDSLPVKLNQNIAVKIHPFTDSGIG